MGGKYRAYPGYKDSTVTWLGYIPEHWIVSLIKYLSTAVSTGGTPKNPLSFTDDIEVCWFNPGDLNGSAIIEKSAKHVTLKSCVSGDARLYEEGSVIVIGIGATLGKVGYCPQKFSCNQQINVIAPNQKILGMFLMYALSVQSEQMKQISNASTIGIMNQEKTKTLALTLPPKNEQFQITKFLDHETAKIDTLIEKQQQLIKLLKEKRQAVISHAVTKGLNPDAPMRDSGVEWLGDVPGHWNVSYLGFECSVKARLGWKGLKAEEYVDEGYVFLATPNIKSQKIDFDNVHYITRERYEESPEIMLEVGDVLVTKDGSTTGTTNVVRELPAPTTVNSSIAVLRSAGSIEGLYLFYFFVSTYTQNVIKRMQDGMGVPHLFQADLRKFNVLKPPLAEQLEIVADIESRLPKFDALLKKANQEILLLHERRTALISAAVTGKIDVRDWHAPERSQTDEEEAA